MAMMAELVTSEAGVARIGSRAVACAGLSSRLGARIVRHQHGRGGCHRESQSLGTYVYDVAFCALSKSLLGACRSVLWMHPMTSSSR
jgi:hypothetical protein